jgi:anti-sigma B factor antagonist
VQPVLENVLVVRIAGDIDMATAPDLQKGISENLKIAPDALIILDLTAVTFLGSAGLNALLQAAQRQGDSLRILIGADNPRVERPIEIAGLAEILAPCHTLEAALSQQQQLQQHSSG